MKNSSHASWWLEEWINSSLITLETQMLLWAGTEVRLHISVGMTSEWVCCSLNLLFFSFSIFSPRKQMEDCCDPAHLFAMTKMNSPMGKSMWYDGEFLYSFTIDNSTYSLFPQVSIEFSAFSLFFSLWYLEDKKSFLSCCWPLPGGEGGFLDCEFTEVKMNIWYSNNRFWN